MLNQYRTHAGRNNTPSATSLAKSPIPLVAHNASVHAPIVLPRPVIQSRINLQRGNADEGWQHVVAGHFSNTSSKSQFTISQDELRSLLQHRDIVSIPVTRTLPSMVKIDGVYLPRTIYERVVQVNRNIGLDKFNSNRPTNIMTILTDNQGNLVTVTPGRIK